MSAHPARFPVPALVIFLVLASARGEAQTTSRAPGIDLEVYNPVNGSNQLEVDTGDIFWLHLHFRPGPGATTCEVSCGQVEGGSSHLSSGLIRLGFDPARLKLLDAEPNLARQDAAGEALLDLRHSTDGFLGWTLAGDWQVDGDPSSGALENPCQARALTEEGWLLRARFQALAPGSSTVTVVGPPQFPITFADLCGGPTYGLNAGIDELVSAKVKIRGSGVGACIPGTTVLCVDDEAGDRRFRVTVAWETSQGSGSSGAARAVSLAPLGMTQGGLFWFFDRGNPEVLVKVLNGCGINGHYWIFFSAGTNVGLTVEVTDTLSGETWVLLNSDGTVAPPKADVKAFACP